MFYSKYFGDFGVSFAATVAWRYTRRGGPRLSVGLQRQWYCTCPAATRGYASHGKQPLQITCSFPKEIGSKMRFVEQEKLWNLNSQRRGGCEASREGTADGTGSPWLVAVAVLSMQGWTIFGTPGFMSNCRLGWSETCQPSSNTHLRTHTPTRSRSIRKSCRKWRRP